jgi:hypothetical protein
MKKTELVNGRREKICLLFEKFVIYSFFIMTIVELIFLINLMSIYNQKSRKYFYNLMEKRLVVKSYIGLLTPVSKNEFKKNGDKCPQDNSEPQSILDLETFTDVSLKNNSDKVMILDTHPKSDTGIENNFYAKKLFYEIDIGKKNDSNVELVTTYQFVNWRTYFICVFKITLENDAIMFYPINHNCSSLGKYVYECGTFHDTYKMCVNAEKLRVKKTKLSSLIEKNEYKVKDVCPYNYINFDFEEMKLNRNQTIDNFAIKIRKNNFTEDLIEKQDKILLIDSDISKYGNYQIIKDPDDQIFFDRPENNFQFNVSRGYDDDISEKIDSYPISELFNDTFFSSTVTNKKTNETSYEPVYLMGINDKQFFKIIDSSTDKINITFSTYNFKAFSKKCFNALLKKEGDYQYNFFKIIRENSTNFLNRTFSYMFAWIITKLILSYYWDIKIRLFYVRNLLANSLNEADQNAEYITKLTGKVFIGAIYGILIYGTIYHKVNFLNIIKNSNNLYDNDCFEDNLINKSIKSYIEYVTEMDLYNFNLFILFFISGGMQGFLLSYYILDTIWKKAQEKLMYLQNKLKNHTAQNEENITVKKDN